MIPIVNIETIRKIETTANESGLSYADMMDRAGQAIAVYIQELIMDSIDPKVTFLCGKGNNGGDGLVAAHYLSQDFSGQLNLYLLTRKANDPLLTTIANNDIFIAYDKDDRDHRVLRNMIASSDLIIDALFGIGVRLPIRGRVNKVLRSVNQALNTRREELRQRRFLKPNQPHREHISGPIMLAVDCPSGLNCNTGEIDRNIVFAHETLTFIAPKVGQLCFPGASAVGNLTVVDIGVSNDFPDMHDQFLVDGDYVRQLLPKRSVNSNKGTFGKVMIVAGSMNYTGAPALAAHGAYRSGAGLVAVSTPSPVATTLAAQHLESIWLILPHDMGVISENAANVVLEILGNYDALLIGPGISQEKTTGKFLANLLNTDQPVKSTKRKGIGFSSAKDNMSQGKAPTPLELPPLVIDADGLNLLAKLENWWALLPDHSIITPHPGEMARLCNLSTQDVIKNRIELVQEKANEWKMIVLLKGAHTLIAEPNGQLAILPFKNDGLATAGTGDVLAGIISGFLAQGLGAFNAAVVGGYLHGLAAGLAVTGRKSTRSMIASDLLGYMGEAFHLIEG